MRNGALFMCGAFTLSQSLAHHMHYKTGRLSFLPKVCEWQGWAQSPEEPNLGRVAEKA